MTHMQLAEIADDTEATEASEPREELEAADFVEHDEYSFGFDIHIDQNGRVRFTTDEVDMSPVYFTIEDLERIVDAEGTEEPGRSLRNEVYVSSIYVSKNIDGNVYFGDVENNEDMVYGTNGPLMLFGSEVEDLLETARDRAEE